MTEVSYEYMKLVMKTFEKVANDPDHFGNGLIHINEVKSIMNHMFMLSYHRREENNQTHECTNSKIST